MASNCAAALLNATQVISMLLTLIVGLLAWAALSLARIAKRAVPPPEGGPR
jgi:hypothetical protein